jgi:hypothetical protein
MRFRVVALALATFFIVTAVATVGLGELLRSCGYAFTPNSVCGLGVCSSPYVCTSWSPALIVGPCLGLLAGAGAIRRLTGQHRRAAT